MEAGKKNRVEVELKEMPQDEGQTSVEIGKAVDETQEPEEEVSFKMSAISLKDSSPYDAHPRWIGSTLVFWYVNNNPVFVIGPHCIRHPPIL